MSRRRKRGPVRGQTLARAWVDEVRFYGRNFGKARLLELAAQWQTVTGSADHWDEVEMLAAAAARPTGFDQSRWVEHALILAVGGWAWPEIEHSLKRAESAKSWPADLDPVEVAHALVSIVNVRRATPAPLLCSEAEGLFHVFGPESDVCLACGSERER